MKNQEFTIKSERYVYFGGEIVNKELHLISEVYGEDWDSEQHIDFSRKDTAKIFSKMTLEEFKEFCATNGTRGLDEFIKKNKLHPHIITI